MSFFNGENIGIPIKITSKESYTFFNSIVITVVIFLSAFAVVTASQIAVANTPQTFSVYVTDKTGQPLANVQVQGFMIAPPSNGLIFKPIFRGITDKSG